MKHFIAFAIITFLLTACAHKDIKTVNSPSQKANNMQSEKQKNDNNSGAGKSETLNNVMDKIASTLFQANKDDNDVNLDPTSLSDIIPLVQKGTISKKEIVARLKTASKELEDKKAEINAGLYKSGEFDDLDNETKARLVNSMNDMLDSIKTHIDSAAKDIKEKNLSKDETVALLEGLAEKSAETTMVAMQDLMEFIMEAVVGAMQEAFGAITLSPSSDENNDDDVDTNTNNNEIEKLSARILESYYQDLSGNTFVLFEEAKNNKWVSDLFENHSFDGSQAIPYYGFTLQYDKTLYDLDSIIEIVSKEYFPNYLTNERMYYLITMLDKEGYKFGAAKCRALNVEKKIYEIIPDSNIYLNDYILDLSDELLTSLLESSLDLSKIKSSLVNFYGIDFVIFYDDKNTMAARLKERDDEFLDGNAYFLYGELYPIPEIIRYFEQQK